MEPDRPATGVELARRYAEDRVAAGSSTAELTATAETSELLRVGYGHGFLPGPVVLTAAERRALAEDLTTVHELLRALPERLFGGDLDAFGAAVGMTPAQRAASSPGPGPLSALARSDLYRTDDGFRLLELNVTSALGGFENAEINRAMLATPALSRFVAANGLDHVDTFARIVAVLRHDCAPFLSGSRPVVALVDWPESFRTYAPRLQVWARMFAEFGIEALPCHVGHLDAGPDGVRLGGRRVDVVYRFFLIEEIEGPADLDAVTPLLDAVRAGTVGVFARMDAELYGNKGALAMLGDDAHADVFSARERACVDRFLPWTRPMRAGDLVGPGGEVVDARAFALDQQAGLLLKPTLLHGGSGITTGWRADPATWRAAVDAALGAPGWVLQQRVRPLAEPFPDPDGGAVREYHLNWGAFFADPAVTGEDGYAGCIVRGSPDPDVGIVSMRDGALVGCCFDQGGRPR